MYSGTFSGDCSICGKIGHFSSDCRELNAQRNSTNRGNGKAVNKRNISGGENKKSSDSYGTSVCYRCHKIGHFARECPEIDNYPKANGFDNGKGGFDQRRFLENSYKNPSDINERKQPQNYGKEKYRNEGEYFSKKYVSYEAGKDLFDKRKATDYFSRDRYYGDGNYQYNDSLDDYDYGLRRQNKKDYQKVTFEGKNEGCFSCGRSDHFTVECPGREIRRKVRENERYRRDDSKGEYYKREKEDKLTGRECFICDKTGHYARDCPKRAKNLNKVNGKEGCFYCGRFGHFAKDCAEKHNASGRYESRDDFNDKNNYYSRTDRVSRQVGNRNGPYETFYTDYRGNSRVYRGDRDNDNYYIGQEVYEDRRDYHKRY